MTFIASVIAKNGVAIIADSLITTSQPILEFDKFNRYFEVKYKESKNNKMAIDIAEIAKLFDTKPSYTKDYEDKLFKYDDFSCLTTAGSATINGKRVSHIISEIIDKNLRSKKSYKSKRISTKVKDFVKLIEIEARSHVKKQTIIGETIFILTHFDKKKGLTSVYKISVKDASTEDLKDEKFKLVSFTKTFDFEKVVCDGQNKLTQGILYGELYSVPKISNQILPKIIDEICDQIHTDHSINTEEFRQKLLKKYVFTDDIFKEVQLDKLSDLSLQQAVDLAALLMRLEIDFQKYTQNIPTVGGVIKLAVIDKSGFRFITGENIEVPLNI